MVNSGRAICRLVSAVVAGCRVVDCGSRRTFVVVVKLLVVVLVFDECSAVLLGLIN